MPLAADDFTPYGAAHLTAVAVLVLGALGLWALARATRARDPDDRLGKGLAIALLVATVPLQVLYFTPAHWNLDKTLPVQLCDLASLVSVYALWTHRWWAVGLTYYWGLTLTTQAVATPDLASGVTDPVFWLFWAMHIGTVWAAVHLVWGRGVTPDWRSYRWAVAVTAVWAVGVFCLNLALDTNYGYLNAKPGVASILDLLGPWPWYLLAEVVIVAGAWALVTWPWIRRRSRAEGS